MNLQTDAICFLILFHFVFSYRLIYRIAKQASYNRKCQLKLFPWEERDMEERKLTIQKELGYANIDKEIVIENFRLKNLKEIEFSKLEVEREKVEVEREKVEVEREKVEVEKKKVKADWGKSIVFLLAAIAISFGLANIGSGTAKTVESIFTVVSNFIHEFSSIVTKFKEILGLPIISVAAICILYWILRKIPSSIATNVYNVSKWILDKIRRIKLRFF